MTTHQAIAVAASLSLVTLTGLAWTAAATSDPSSELRAANSFASINDPVQRSAALFVEAGRVLQHSRCVNCHPAGDRPSQGEDGQVHDPWVRRGSDGHGAVGMRCATCHHAANFDPGGVPGAPNWQLAPRSMAWQGKTLAEICAQLKDPKRNGGRSLKDVARHMKEDALVGWAWAPGTGREPAPGTQEDFGQLIEGWIETGAACPE